MTRPRFHVALRLLVAVLFHGDALPLVGRIGSAVRQQEQAHFLYQTEHLPLKAEVQQRLSPDGPVFFAAAFSIPTASHVAGHVGIMQPSSTLCEKGNTLGSSYRSFSGGSALNACAADQHRLAKRQPTWTTLRTASTTSAGLSDSTAAPAAHTSSVLLPGDPSYRILNDSPTAVSAGAGGLLTSPPAEAAAASELSSAIDHEPSPVTMSALPSLVANVELAAPQPPDAALHAAVAEAETPDAGKSSTMTAAAAREGESEKTPAATPLGPVVTRKDLVASLTAELQLPRADVERTIAALLRHITANLEVGRKVSISKFGSFNVRRRKERVARNPRTGEALNVAAATFPTFSFSKVLKERVRDVVPILGEEENEEESEDKSEEPVQSEKKGKHLYPWS